MRKIAKYYCSKFTWLNNFFLLIYFVIFIIIFFRGRGAVVGMIKVGRKTLFLLVRDILAHKCLHPDVPLKFKGDFSG